MQIVDDHINCFVQLELRNGKR